MDAAGPRCSPQRGGIFLRLLKWFSILAFLGILYLLRGPILRSAGEFWVEDEGAQPADAIVVLSDDNYRADRAARAAELFREGWAPRVVASGRYLRPYAGIAELMQRDLADRGVPPTAVVRLAHVAANTREEAVIIRRLVDRQHWKRVLIVTSNFHTRRAARIFHHVFKNSAHVRVVAAPDSGYNPASWWRSRSGVKLFFLESASYPLAIWETRSTEAATRGLHERESLPSTLWPATQ